MFQVLSLFKTAFISQTQTNNTYIQKMSYLLNTLWSWFKSQGNQVIAYSSSFSSIPPKLCTFTWFSRLQLCLRNYLHLFLWKHFAPMKYVVTLLSFSREPLSLCLLLLLPQGQTSTCFTSTCYLFLVPSELHAEILWSLPVIWPHHFIYISVQHLGEHYLHCQMYHNEIYCRQSWSTDDESIGCWWTYEFSFSISSRAEYLHDEH